MTIAKRKFRKDAAMPWSRRQRLRYLEAFAYWRGTVRRTDLLQRFDIGVQRVSDDIQEYLRLNPGALIYDRNEKVYRAAPRMKPIFGNMEIEEALELLGPRDADAGPWFDRVTLPVRKMKPDVLQQLFRAVATTRSICIRYASLNSATYRWRWITPHAFGHDGFRWHARAFCHEERTFKDFVIGRISAVREQGDPAASAKADYEWKDVKRLQLRAAPKMSEAEVCALELDFGLKEGQLIVPVRTALVLYLLVQLGLNRRGEPAPRRFAIASISCP